MKITTSEDIADGILGGANTTSFSNEVEVGEFKRARSVSNISVSSIADTPRNISRTNSRKNLQVY